MFCAFIAVCLVLCFLWYEELCCGADEEITSMCFPFLLEGQAGTFPVHYHRTPNVTIDPRNNRLTLTSGDIPL